jgi:CheY-like chemotaxis protein
LPLEVSLRVDGRPARAVLNWLWLALAYQKQGNAAEARRWLDRAAYWLDQQGGRMPLAVNVNLMGAHRHNWLEAHVLRQEAAALLLDSRIPDTDGLAVAAMIRESADLAATRIILLTSGDRPGEAARFRDLRIDAHLLKPVQQNELLETIYRVMSRPAGNGPKTARPAPAEATATTAVPAAPPLHVRRQRIERAGPGYFGRSKPPAQRMCSTLGTLL